MQRPTIWESSTRPLYPKCVWVAGSGFRHFILDHDINKKRKIQHNNTSQKNSGIKLDKEIKSIYQRSDLNDLRLVGYADNLSRERFNGARRQANNSRNCKPNSPNVRNNKRHVTIKDKKTSKEPSIREEPASQSTELNILKQPTNELELSKNQLTERVLQWLDLAGRQTLLRQDTASSNEVVPQRRIYTTESIKKPQPLSSIRRSESVHHLSLTFNGDDAHSKVHFGKALGASIPSGGNNRQSSSKPSSCKKSISQSSSRRSLLSEIDKFDSLELESTVNQIAANYRSKYDEIENQYRMMIRRQIMENTCNTQLAKRQLHIFMPKLPKRYMNTAGDSDSCFSSIVSKII